MLVPLSWLREYVDFDLDVAVLANRVTELGMQVESVRRIGQDWRDIVVGELLEVTPHPHADRLLLARVHVGEGSEPLPIVSGATNIAAGQRVPVALPGAELPGGRQITVSRIQGIESRGMLCSGDELRLTPDADGILVLDDGAPPPGTPLEELVGEVVLDVDVKPNRGDALSMIGLAREVAALTGGRIRWPDISVSESGDATADHVQVSVVDADLCSRFVARYVDSIHVAPSPLNVQLRLNAAGIRPLSNIVDASNYVMLELGKPIHTFDAAAVADGQLVVRRAERGESLQTLDHVHRELTPETLVIADPRGPIGIAGVMGGADSEVGPDTQAVVIESAVFDPVSIRRTAQRYALRSEASQRFEKGQEPRLARLGADRTAQLIADWAGGRPAVGVIDTDPRPDTVRRVVFRPRRVSRLLGEDIDGSKMSELLARAEIATEPATPDDRLVVFEGAAGAESARGPSPPADALVALVPPHRRDISIEADVAEEVIRLRGYTSLEPRLPDTPMPGFRPDPRRFVDQVRDLLSGRGLSEVVTEELISPADHARLGLADDDPQTIRLANPVSIDRSELRRSLLPGLVRVIAANERQRRDDVGIFEIGPIHAFADGEPAQTDQVGIVISGAWQPASWTDAPRPARVEDVKGVVEWLVERIGHASVRYDEASAADGVEHPGRTAVIAVDTDGQELGRVGELHPRYLAAAGVRAERVAFALLDVGRLRKLEPPSVLVPVLPRLPAAERDLAVIVPENMAQARVADVIRAAAGPHLAALTLFDRYQGPPLGEGEFSLAYRLRFQPLDRPIDEHQLDETMAAVTRALDESLGLRLRGTEIGDRA